MPFDIHEWKTLPSTNDEANRMASRGAPGFTAVWSHEQTAGRGRLGRCWESPSGNLYVSLLLRPKCTVSVSTQLSLVAAVALGDTLCMFVEASRIQNKWPNDVQIDNKKLAGLLLETSTKSRSKVDAVIIGCGVNIASCPNLANYPTTYLNLAASRVINVRSFLDNFLEKFEYRYMDWHNNGIEYICDAWITRAIGIGQEIIVRFPNSEVRGIFEGLDSSGALILGTCDGERKTINSGEVFTES